MRRSLILLIICAYTGFSLCAQTRPSAGLPLKRAKLISLPVSGTVAVGTLVAGSPVGRFLTDTIEIGRPFQFSLSVQYAPKQDVIFPDTAHAFAPFIVRDMIVFSTVTQDLTGSRDSAVYTLVSFETAPAQLLRVPVLLTSLFDSIVVLSTPDTVFLRSRLPLTNPRSATLLTETTPQPLRQQFNYPYLILAVLGLGMVISLVYWLFNEAINRQWRLYRLAQQYQRFSRGYNRVTQGINSNTASDAANQAVVRWKTYIERLEQQPFSSLTTSEIADRLANDQLIEALKEADRMIYGGAFSDQSLPALRVLRDVATQTYNQRRRLMKQTRRQQTDTGVINPTEP